jgi:hypothetical protein
VNVFSVALATVHAAFMGVAQEPVNPESVIVVPFVSPWLRWVITAGFAAVTDSIK